MLTEIRLRHWKSFDDATLHVDPLTVLIGINSSGKSNALDALLFLKRAGSGSHLSTALQGDLTLPALRGGIEWAAMRPGNDFSIRITISVDNAVDFVYQINCQIQDNHCDLVSETLRRLKFRTDKQGHRLRDIAPRITHLFWTDPCPPGTPSITARLYNGKGGTSRSLSRSHTILHQLAAQPLRQEIKEGIAVVSKDLQDIFLLDPIPSHMRSYSPLSERLDTDASNIAGVIAALPAARKQEIEDCLTRYAGDLPEGDIQRIYAETVGRFGADAMLYCEEKWLSEGEAPILDARGMSDGTLRFLAVLTALLTRPAKSLLVIEEVDNGLHPSRAGLLLKVLEEEGRRRQIDVVVSTHSPALLNAMDIDRIPYITVAYRDPHTGTSCLTPLEDLDQLPRLLAQGKVGQLASLGLIEKATHRTPSHLQ